MKGKFGKIGILCLAVLMALVAVGVGLAHWQETVTIETTVETGTWEVGGTPGFWGSWDSHNTYTKEDIEGWLFPDIDTPSHWLVPDMDGNDIIDINDMQAVFAAGEGGTMEEKFLAHYLATRLNAKADRLYLGTTHDVIGISGYSYLGLATPAFATLTDIIVAIESKYGTPPTEGEFEIMKNICDALNNMEI